MTMKVEGSTGIEFPDGSVQSTAADAGPAFSAVNSATFDILNITNTKFFYQTEEFDTADDYNPVQSRFQPSVAGYYQITATCSISTNGISIAGSLYAALRKNGVEFKRGTQAPCTSSLVSALVYLNGTTDYVEVYCYQNYGNTQTPNLGISYFQGFLARKA